MQALKTWHQDNFHTCKVIIFVLPLYFCKAKCSFYEHILSSIWRATRFQIMVTKQAVMSQDAWSWGAAKVPSCSLMGNSFWTLCPHLRQVLLLLHVGKGHVPPMHTHIQVHGNIVPLLCGILSIRVTDVSRNVSMKQGFQTAEILRKFVVLSAASS